MHHFRENYLNFNRILIIVKTFKSLNSFIRHMYYFNSRNFFKFLIIKQNKIIPFFSIFFKFKKSLLLFFLNLKK